MGDLGEFGVERPELDESFRYFGERIRVHPDVTDLLLLDFMTKADEIEEDDPRAVRMIADLLHGMIHGEDFDRFWSTAMRNRQTSTDLMEAVFGILAKLTDRPTQQPSDSSAGRLATVTRLRGDSLSVAMAQTEGRPDLQEIIMRRQRDAAESA